MSLFEHPDIDSVLLTYLSIDDLKVLSQVSRYYHKLIKDILQPFREFFKTRNNLIVNLLTSDFYEKPSEMRVSYRLLSNVNKMFLQSIIYDNYDIVIYVYKYNPNMMAELRYEVDESEIEDGYESDITTHVEYLISIALRICIQKKTNYRLVEFIVNLYSICKSLNPKRTRNIEMRYLTYDYHNDFYKVKDLIYKKLIYKN